MTFRLGLAALFVCSTLAAAAGTTRNAPPTSVATLIERLGSADFRERQQAARLLEARGPDALPDLRKAVDHPDLEVRFRVQAIIRLLEARRALEPKRVTLAGDVLPLSAVVKDLARQTGYQLTSDGGPDPRCRIEVRGVPFWEAMERISRETGHQLSVAGHINTTNDSIHLMRTIERSPFVVLSGPFRVEATRFHEDRDVDFHALATDRSRPGRRDHLLTLRISILAEPKFIVLAAGRAQVDVALDENDKSLVTVADPEKGKIEVEDLTAQSRRNCACETTVLLRRSSERARSIKVLRGTIPVLVVVERNRIVVTEKLRDVRHRTVRVGDESIAVSTTVDDDGEVRVGLEVDRDQKGACCLDQRMSVEDSQGHVYSANGWGGSSGGRTVGISRVYAPSKDPKVGPPSRLILEEWVTMIHPIPFEFKDVPLP